MSCLAPYKAFVKQHPSLVLNVQRLLHWFAWNPERFSGSEYAYEAFNAVVGLLGIYHDSILAEGEQDPDLASWALWLAAVEQVQTLIELRAIQMEQRGKMSRYSPLICLELLKALLRLGMWRRSRCTLALDTLSRDDQAQHDSEQQLKELLQALKRLRERYDYDPVTALTPEHLQLNAGMAQASAVRAAALAPNRPPTACQLATSMALSNSSGASSSSAAVAAVTAAADHASQVYSQQQHPQQQLCRGGSSSANPGEQHQGPQQQQQHIEPNNGRSNSSSSSSSSNDPALGAVPPDSAVHASSNSSSSSGLVIQGERSISHKSWWQSISSLSSGSSPSTPSRQWKWQAKSDTAVPAVPSRACGSPGALPGSWGPGLRPSGHSCSSRQAGKAALVLPPQQVWKLSNRDDSIGECVMWAGELLHVLRPLVYVCLLRQCGLRSWKPWLLSLGLDLASSYGLHTGHTILGRSKAAKWPPSSTLYSLALLRSLNSNKWSPGEQQELVMRQVQLLRYLLRSPCYDVATRRVLQQIVAASRWVPGLSKLAEFAFSMIEGMQSYYTYVES